MKKRKKGNEYIKKLIVDYKGGCSAVTKSHMNGASIRLYKDKIVLTYFFKDYLTIPLEDIISIKSKSESEVSKDVTLPRLFFLGIFAFGAKKRRKKENRYIIIEFKDEDYIEKLCLQVPMFSSFGTDLISSFIQEYRKCRRRYN